MMNKTPTLFESAEDQQLFAEILIDYIEKKHHFYERERVPLANIHFKIIDNGIGDFIGIGDFNSHTGIPHLQEIAKMQGNPDEGLLTTAQRMLDLFQQLGEIEKSIIDDQVFYKLRKEGRIYKHLADKLECTP